MNNLTTLGTLGPYRLLSLLGVGGMAEVYRAYDPRLDREVAIKLLPVDLAKRPGFLERFRREARAVARLDHPNIMPIYDSGEEDGVLYVVMPLIEDGTLRDRIAQRGVCSLREAMAIVYQVALALHEAHQHGLVHRDVKPANILLAPGERAVLADFGIACALAHDAESDITQAGMGIGTAEYMSPEQAQGGPVDHRADVYALGIVLFQALTGRVPFSATDHFLVAYQQVHQTPPTPRSVNPTVPPAVEALILKALEKDPARRFQSAAQFAAALAGAVPTLHLPGAPLPASGSQKYAPPSAAAPVVVADARQDGRASAEMGAASWSAWTGTLDDNSLTVPGLPWQPAERVRARGQRPTPSRSGGRWLALVGLALAVLLIAGAAAVGRIRSQQQLALSPPTQAPQAPQATAPPPTATATPATPAYYKAQFFELAQGDLLGGDQLGEQMSISNDQYQMLEGKHGTLYQSGAATRFGRAFGTGTVIRDGDGNFRFVVLVDRFATAAEASQYYQYQAGLLSQTTAVPSGEEALAGLARIQEDHAVYRLILHDENVVITFATSSTDAPLDFQSYFAQLAQVIDQRGHRCLYTPTLTPLPDSPAMCAGQ